MTVRAHKQAISGQISDTWGGRFRPAPSQKLGPPLLTNRIGHWDARVASSIAASGGEITAWYDQSGSNYTLVSEHGGGDRPLYGSRDWGNGVIVPDFVSTYGLYNTSLGAYDETRTIYVVAIHDSLSTYGCLVGSFNEQNIGMWIADSAGTHYISTQRTVGPGDVRWLSNGNSVATGTKYVLMQRAESSTVISYAVNNVITTTSWTAPGYNNENYLVVGHGHFYRDYARLDGAIAEILIYDGVHTNTESTYTINNLRDKWGF